MLRLTKFVAVLLLALWLPATLHCRLEGLGLDALFSCADDAAKTTGSGCTDDGCQSLEDGQFALGKTRIDPAVLPLLACAGVPCFLRDAPLKTAPEIVVDSAEDMAPWQRTWQFARRAALPARAPDSQLT